MRVLVVCCNRKTENMEGYSVHRLRTELAAQGLRYGMVGLFCTGLDGAVFTLLCGLWGQDPYLSNLLSIHLGILCGFFLHRRFTFRQRDRLAVRFLRFYAVGVSGLLLSQMALWVGVQLGAPLWLNKLGAAGGSAALQFCLNRHLTFQAEQNSRRCREGEACCGLPDLGHARL